MNEAALARLTSDDARGEIRFGTGIFVSFFVIFLGWAAFAPLDAAVVAPGVVVVSGSRQTVQHRDGGVISQIHIQDGEHADRRARAVVQPHPEEALGAERLEALVPRKAPPHAARDQELVPGNRFGARRPGELVVELRGLLLVLPESDDAGPRGAGRGKLADERVADPERAGELLDERLRQGLARMCGGALGDRAQQPLGVTRGDRLPPGWNAFDFRQVLPA